MEVQVLLATPKRRHFMKKAYLLLTLPLLLTGCFSTSVKKDKFQAVLQEAEKNVALDSNKLDDVRIHNKLSVDLYNYKEGEFYSYRYFALILIVPVSHGEYTWKEDGKYYYAETFTDSKKNKTGEITEEQFNTRMAAHRLTIYQKINEPLNDADKILNDNYDEGYTVDNYKMSKEFLGSSYSLKAEISHLESDYSSGEEVKVKKTSTHTIKIKNGLPNTYTSKTDDSETKWTYEFGKASFSNPNNPSQDE